MLIAAFQLASRPKPGHETLKEIETSYKTSRDTTFGRRELEIRTEAKLQCGKAQKRYFQARCHISNLTREREQSDNLQ